LREIIEDGRNGLLVPPADPDAWAAALKRLLEDRHLRKRLAATAHTDFISRHTWQQRASRVITGLASASELVNGDAIYA
jgi:glycosyltransferase involved in cell wall biosynthesis